MKETYEAVYVQPDNSFYCMGTGKYKARRVPLHRLIMAQHLDRPLLRTELVHHIDGNKRNNNISNLVIVSSKEHFRIETIVSLKKHIDNLKRDLHDAEEALSKLI